MSKARLPILLSEYRKDCQINAMWRLLREAYGRRKPDVEITVLVEQTAGRPISYAYRNYVGARASHMNRLLEKIGSPARVKPGKARGTYAITL